MVQRDWLTATTCILAFLTLSPINPGHAGWSTNSTVNNPLSTATNIQTEAYAASDGLGGMIVAWSDYRRGRDNPDIYAQRIDVNGNIQWSSDGTAICREDGSQRLPVVASDGAGGAIIAWLDQRGLGDMLVYARRISPSGALLDPTKILLGSTGQQSMYSRALAIAGDGAGGAIVTWQSVQNSNWDIVASRITRAGGTPWGSIPIQVFRGPGEQTTLAIANSSSGDVVIAWQDEREGAPKIMAQRVNLAGRLQWSVSGVTISSETGSQELPWLIESGTDEHIVAWQHRLQDGTLNLYGQRLNSLGNTLWSPNGVAVARNIGGWNVQYPSLISDGEGGAIFTWSKRVSDVNQDISAQRINRDGVSLWPADGVAVCSESETQHQPTLVHDGTGGAIVVWEDYRRSVSKPDIYGQRINSTGVSQWAANGRPISLANGFQVAPTLVASGTAGNAIIAWQDSRRGIDQHDVYSQLIYSDGTLAKRVDFNHDGQTDLLLRNALTGKNTVWLMNGAAFVTGFSLPDQVDRNKSIVGIADFNKDNNPDILWRSATGENTIWLMNGEIRTSEVSLPPVAEDNWTVAGTGDFNRDGNVDILWRHWGSHRGRVWYMRGTNRVSIAETTLLGDLDWQIVGVDDFNFDDKPDILWRNRVSGMNLVWFMDGHRFASMGGISREADVTYNIAGTGDFNSDGSTDIIWQQSSGDNRLWLMNGTTLLSSLPLPPRSPNWYIMNH